MNSQQTSLEWSLVLMMAVFLAAVVVLALAMT